MLQFFRNFFKSKVGIVVTLAFLGLIAFAFASGDVANTGTFGGVTGGDRVAVVGDRRIDTSDLSVRASDTLNRIRQDDPTMTMEGFIANDGLTNTLEAMISRASIAEMGQLYGLRAGSRLVDSEIVSNPNMRGADGSFNTEAFRSALRQQGISEAMFRDDLAMGLFTRQMIGPVSLAPRIPASVVRRYAQLRMETRNGSIAALMASEFVPTGDPTDAQLSAYFDENSDDYIRPERRIIRYATFGEDAFADIPAPTEAQIAQRFERDAQLYSERETRSFTQLIATTQAAAQAIVDEVNGGVSLQASARSKGLSTASLPATTREDMATDISGTVARAAFGTPEGSVSTPVQGPLGWYILRPDNVEKLAARSLAQVRDEISATLAAEQRRVALNDATARIEDDFSSGKNLTEVAADLGLEIESTRSVTAAGQVYGTQETAPQILAPIFAVAFEMDEADPQVAEVVPGETFIIFDVGRITRSAVAPLDEIRDDVVSAWRVDEGMKAAGLAVGRILDRVEGGSTLAQAIRAEKASLPGPEAVSLSRAQVEASGNISRPIALFFSMAKDTIKSLEAEEVRAWFIVALDDIVTPDIADDSDLVTSTDSQLRPLLPDEYSEQFVRAVQQEIEVDINDVAVDAVAAQLTGRTN